MNQSIIITIDGPAGSGKSTVAAKLAAQLNIAYLDTGAMYRAVTLAALNQNTPLQDPHALADLTKQCQIKFQRNNNLNIVLLNDLDVTEAIRTPQVTNAAHFIASATEVRQILVKQQQAIGREVGSLVTEGRDQGTVVFPNAQFKFFLDASPQCRAQRRFLELKKKEIETSYEDILADQIKRDQRDSSRKVGPLKASDDAIRVDTTDMTIEQVVGYLYQYIQKHKNKTIIN